MICLRPLLLFTLLVLITTNSSGSNSRLIANEPWLSHYSGGISWEAEQAYLDNFAIQIMNDPNLIGYILIYSGEDSCRDEAQARALRMKNYMTEVRGVPWNKVMWKSAGGYRSKGLEIFHLGIPRAALATLNFPYEPPAHGQIIRTCASRGKDHSVMLRRRRTLRQ